MAKRGLSSLNVKSGTAMCRDEFIAILPDVYF